MKIGYICLNKIYFTEIMKRQSYIYENYQGLLSFLSKCGNIIDLSCARVTDHSLNCRIIKLHNGRNAFSWINDDFSNAKPPRVAHI